MKFLFNNVAFSITYFSVQKFLLFTLACIESNKVSMGHTKLFFTNNLFHFSIHRSHQVLLPEVPCQGLSQVHYRKP